MERRVIPPGEIARLSQGDTCYQWNGPEDAPVTVCIHGLTTPSLVWKALLPHLVAKGQRVLTYDLYGRGFSQAPRGAQTPAFFIRQLCDLLDHQGIDGPVSLIGYSMGGAIATSFAAAHPERARDLSLIAPAGMGHELGFVARFTRDVPLLGDWLFFMGYPRQLRAGIAAEQGLPTTIPELADYQYAQLRQRGFLPAVLSSIRGQLRHPLVAEHRAICQSRVPVKAIWGRDDPVIPIAAMDRLTEWNPKVEHWVIDGAGHGLPYTHTGELAELL